MSQKVHISNKRARFEFEILEEFVAGISLLGTEIKSIRAGKARITEFYCAIKDGELFIRNMHISPYEHGGHYNHNPTRERKLLLKRQEIDKLDKKVATKGLTIVPLSVFITEKGWAKMKVGLARGRKIHDKRQVLKGRDQKRDMDRADKAR